MDQSNTESESRARNARKLLENELRERIIDIHWGSLYDLLNFPLYVLREKYIYAIGKYYTINVNLNLPLACQSEFKLYMNSRF